MINAPVIMYKMLRVKFNDKSYRLTDNGYTGISFEVYDDYSGWSSLDQEELEAEFNNEERYAMEKLFDK